MTSVRVEQGILAGGHAGDVHRFLGVPFAAPPVGPLRWRAAAPPAPWDGVRDATEFGNAPIQTAVTSHTPSGKQSEDCLYLNIWTTTLDRGARQPVMFWIHGGGFLNGASSMPNYDGAALARRGIIVVSVEYRLGAFGFLTDPDNGANCAVTDWVAGLSWVAANVEAFGGDAANVTVFGQSAGAAAVRALLSAPAARGLFHRAIIQSAGFDDYAVVPSPSYERAAAASARLLTRLNCRSVEDARQVPAEHVRAASLEESGIFPPPDQVHTPANLVWYPAIDGDVITAGFAGWPDDVPVMLGCTEDESRMFITPSSLYAHPEIRPEDAYTPDTLAHMARALSGAAADAVLRHFTETVQTPYEALTEVYTAAVWHEPALATLDTFALAARTSYYYRFARVSPGAGEAGTLACHAAENPYLFGVLQPPGFYDEADVEVSHAVQHAWTEFARTGVPRNRDGSAWPRYDPAEPKLAVIADRTESCALTVSPVTALIHAQRRAQTVR
jgi:para-nitrobenzyl esterase